jgi:hypothetical protein
MKKLGLLTLILAWLSGGVSFAQATLGPDEHWVEQIGGALTIPSSGDAAKAYQVGFGGDLGISYRITPNLSEGIATGYYQFNLQNAGSGDDFSYVPLMEVTRIIIGGEDVKPYVLFGLGVAFNTRKLSTISTTQTDLLMAPGAGVLWRAFPNAALFAQGRLDVDFISKNISHNGTTNPAVFMPLEAGLVFYLL